MPRRWVGAIVGNGRRRVNPVSAVFPERDAILATLGRHKTAKACVYIRALADVDEKALERLVAASYADNKRRHG
jgi:hypothetical protein